MTSNITYWELFSYLKMWFMSRWWDILADDNAIMNYINLTIQDIYNEDNATFRHKIEDLTWVQNWSYRKYTTTFNIHKVQKCFPFVYWSDEVNYNENNKLRPSLFWISNEKLFTFEWKEILTHESVTKIRVIYLVDYEWATLVDKNKPIPVPNRYLPSLFKLAFDWAAPINLMSDEAQATDFYSHWITRLNKITQNDWLTDYIDANPRY